MEGVEFNHLLSKCDVRGDEPLGQHHALLEVHVFVGGGVNEEEILPDEALSHLCDVRLAVALPVIVVRRQSHESFRIGGIYEQLYFKISRRHMQTLILFQYMHAIQFPLGNGGDRDGALQVIVVVVGKHSSCHGSAVRPTPYGDSRRVHVRDVFDQVPMRCDECSEFLSMSVWVLPDYEHRVTGFQGSELMVHRVHESFAYEPGSPDVHVRHHEVQSRCEVVTPFNTESRVNILAARAAVPFGNPKK